MKTALTIAGTDPSGGAGIQADIKTMTANGVFATCAVTALVAQNTTGVKSIVECTPDFLAEELDCVFTDIFPDAVKTGMVSSIPLIRVIAAKLKEYGAKNLVVDPVMVATSGDRLITEDAVSALKELLLPLLACNARPGLDAIINSHPDIDHAGGIPPLLMAFPGALLLHNGQPGSGQMGHIWQTTLQDRNAITLHAGDILQLGDPEDGLALHVLHPPRPVPGAYLWEGNSASLILRLVRNGHGLALFPGDADAAALRHLLASDQDIQADVLLAPHHGSDSSFQPDFLAAVRPRLVVASCGAFNRFGHPGKQLGQWLDEQGIPLLQTGRHGHVRVVWPLSGDTDSPQLHWDTARPVHP